MDEKYKEIIAEKRKLEKERADEYQESSKDRLSKIACKKITTTMIGALESVETHFGFLWQDEESEEAIHMRGVFESVREEILNKGNTQVRNLKNELENYDITWLRFRTEFKVKQPGE